MQQQQQVQRQQQPNPALGDADLFADGAGGFDWEEGFRDMRGQEAPAAASARVSPSEEAQEGEAARPMMDAPAGGYPKRLAGLMSFCRVSDKATCEILVEMGRVTVNGEVATDPAVKVDLLTDIVVANGERSVVTHTPPG